MKRLKQHDGIVADVDALCDHVIAVEMQRANEPPTASLHRRTEKLPRKRWEDKEVQALLDGHAKHGKMGNNVGKPRQVRSKRTTMDLKDKMRNVKGAANKRKQLVDRKRRKPPWLCKPRLSCIYQVFTIMCEAVVRLRSYVSDPCGG